MRDRDVRNAIQALLVNTNVFDAVSLTALAVSGSEASSTRCGASIEPDSSEVTPTWDSAVSGAVIVTSRLHIRFSARHSDPQLRDELAELLVNTASNTLNGQQLNGLCIPQMTRFLSWAWQPPCPPERIINGLFSYQYIVAGWDEADVLP